MSLAEAVSFRDARSEDLAAILALLDADAITRARAGHCAQVTPEVLAAFGRIAAAADHALWVGELDGRVIATLQLSLIPGLTRNGLTRCIVEAVRVHDDLRGRGIGARMLCTAMDWARAHGARQIQLTTDKRRLEAQRFYARLGFEASHEGMKRML